MPEPVASPLFSGGTPIGFLPFDFAQGRLLRPGRGRGSGRNDGMGSRTGMGASPGPLPPLKRGKVVLPPLEEPAPYPFAAIASAIATRCSAWRIEA